MVSPLSLFVLAGVTLLLAGAVGWLRRVGSREAVADGRAALIGTLAALAAAVALFGLSRAAGSELWRAAGSAALLASPLAAVLALRSRGRRSIPRALLAAAVALAAVVLWLTLNFRGPGGGWTPAEILRVLPPAAVALASAACLGWWTKRRRVEVADPAARG